MGRSTRLDPASMTMLGRLSRRTKSMPARVRALAAVRPTGPPPTMMTLKLVELMMRLECGSLAVLV